VSHKLAHSHTESITHSISAALARADDDDEFAGGWGDGGCGYDDDDNDDGAYQSSSFPSSSLPPAPPSPQGLQFSGSGLVQASRKVEKVNIGYATIARRVNVRRLKHDIWHWIDGTEESDSTENENPNPSSSASHESQKISSGKKSDEKMSFHSMVDELGESTREGAQKEATLPFYFICLLHLANEKGLTIKSVDNMDDLVISRDL